MSPTGMRPRGREYGSGRRAAHTAHQPPNAVHTVCVRVHCVGHTSHRHASRKAHRATVSDSHCGIERAARRGAPLRAATRAQPHRPLQQHLERRRLLEPQQLRRQRPPELVHLGGLDREAVVELPPSETTSHAPLRVLPHGIARELDRRAECLSARSSQLGIWESAFTVLSCVCVC